MHKYLLLGSLLIINTVNADRIVQRNAAYCAYLSKRIMCFGGSPRNNGYDSSVNYLDISQSDSRDVSDLENKWEIEVVPTGETSIIHEPRYDSQYTALPGGVSMLMQGGSNEIPNKLQNQTVVYDTVNNAWSSLKDYTDSGTGVVRQIFSGTAAYVSSTNEVAFYGGRETRVPGNYTYKKLDNTTFPKDYTYAAPLPNNNNPFYESYIGFYYLTIYHINSNSWRVPLHQTPFLISPMQMTATYHEKTDTIYYLGGKRYEPSVGDDVVIPLSWCLAFNMASSKWDNITLTGAQIPTPRVLHSATLLTGTNDAILIYGGSPFGEENDPVQDYCYTLDIGDRVWTAHSLNATSPTIGPRYYHNAVLVNDTTLFILLGKTTANLTTNNVSVLDVRNVSAIKFSDQFPLQREPTAFTARNDANDDLSLSSGAIAGIIVGTVAAVTALGIAILLYRKKKRETKEQHKTLDVDWDQIEHHFHEIPPTKRESMTSPTSTLVATVTQVPNAVQSEDINNKNIVSVFHERPMSQTSVVKPDGGKDDKSQVP